MFLPEVESFISIVKTGNFGRSAAALGIAQPSLSFRIKSLEDAVGGILLQRDTRPVKPTALGEALLPYFELALDSINAGLEEAKKLTAG